MINKTVLHIPSWFPTKQKPNRGVFFYHQFKLLSTEIEKTLVFEVSAVSIANAKQLICKHQLEFRKDENLNIYHLTVYRVPPKILGKLRDIYLRKNIIKAWEKIIQKEGYPDLIHAYSTWPAGYYGSILAQNTSIPFIVSEHASYLKTLLNKKYYRSKILKTFSRAKIYTAVSSAMQKELKTFNIENVSVTPNYLDFSQFDNSTQDSSPDSFDQDALHILHISDLSPVKNPKLLFETVKELLHKDRMKSVKLHLIGCKNIPGEWQAFLNKNSLYSAVINHGVIPHKEIAVYLQKSNFLLITSHKETFSMAGIEALSVGTPVISTDCGGPADYIKNGFNGTIVATNDSKDLASKIIEYSDYFFNKEEIIRQIRTTYSPEAVLPKIIDLYSHI